MGTKKAPSIKLTLRGARVNAGYTQSQLAEKLGVSRQAIMNWESGRTKIRKAYLIALSAIYDLPVECFDLKS